MICSDLQHYKVSTIDLISGRTALPTFASVVTHRGSGDRTIFSYHPEKIRYEEDNIKSALDDAGIVLIDGFHINYAKSIAKQAQISKLPVVFDGGSWKKGMGDLLDYIDIAICSENFNPPGTSDPGSVIKYLKNKNIQKIAVTRGDKPILYSEGGKDIQEITVPSIKVSDSLGAGDIFHGAFCYYYLNNFDFKNSLSKASEIAMKSCLYLGTRTWTKE